VKRILLSMMALALVASSATRAAAEDTNKPVAVLAIASYDRLMTDIAFIGNLTGSPDLDKNLEGMIQLFTQGQGLAGLDRKRPLGVSLTTDGLQFQPLIILPVTDLQQLLGALEGLVGPAEETGDGVFELDVFNQQIFVKEKNSWAYLSIASEPLANLPDDANTLFGGLEKTYDLAGRLHIQNVPEVFRTMIVDQLRVGVEAGLARQPDETDEAYESRKKLVDAQINSLTAVINDLDQLTLGVAIQPDAKTANLDLAFTALEGTATAKALGTGKKSPSDFAGFLDPEAAASICLNAELGKGDADQFISGLEAIRTEALKHIENDANLPDEASRKLAAEMVAQVLDAVKATFEEGSIDAGATLNLSEDKLAVVVGAHVADTKKLEEALKKFAKLGETDPKVPKIKFNAAEHAGIQFHSASIDVPAERKVSKVVGDKLDVSVGIGAKAVYLALGSDSLQLAKALIDRSKGSASKEQLPLVANVALERLFKFAAAMSEDSGASTESLQGMIKDLAKAPGKDHVKVEYTPQANGGTIRISAEEGVLLILGSALQNAQASGAIPGFGP
jgi:hypothetical protein